MKAVLIEKLVNLLIKALPATIIKSGIDAMLDKIEDAVAGTETKFDDATVLPLCKFIREALDIPDND